MLSVFKSQHELTYPLLMNGEQTAESYGLGRGVPVAIWVNRAGVISDVELGYHGPGPLLKKTEELLRPSG